MVSFLEKFKGVFGKKGPDILSRQEFTDEFIVFAQPQLPDLDLTVFGSQLINVTQYEKTTPVYLDKVYKLYEETPDKKPVIFEDFLNTLKKKFAKPDQAIDINKIIPLIKNKNWLEKYRSAARSENNGNSPEIIFTELFDDLVVVYAEKIPDDFKYFVSDDLYRTGLAREDVHSTALRNLPEQIGDIQLHQGPGTHMLAANELFESSLCLLDYLLTPEKLPAIKGELVIALPAGDTLIITGSEEEKGLQRTREIITKVFRTSKSPISSKLFIRRNQRWSVFGG